MKIIFSLHIIQPNLLLHRHLLHQLAHELIGDVFWIGEASMLSLVGTVKCSITDLLRKHLAKKLAVSNEKAE